MKPDLNQTHPDHIPVDQTSNKKRLLYITSLFATAILAASCRPKATEGGTQNSVIVESTQDTTGNTTPIIIPEQTDKMTAQDVFRIHQKSIEDLINSELSKCQIGTTVEAMRDSFMIAITQSHSGQQLLPFIKTGELNFTIRISVGHISTVQVDSKVVDEFKEEPTPDGKNMMLSFSIQPFIMDSRGKRIPPLGDIIHVVLREINPN